MVPVFTGYMVGDICSTFCDKIYQNEEKTGISPVAYWGQGVWAVRHYLT